MVEISMYGSGEGPGAVTSRAYSTSLRELWRDFWIINKSRAFIPP